MNFDLDDIIADDERADAVFNAAVEFLAESGVYNRSTSRVIKWTEDEIKEMVREYQETPRTFVAGAGKEAIEKAVAMMKAAGVPISEGFTLE